MTRKPTPGEARYIRPDASMSLLVNMMDHSLDEGYAEATARRAVRGGKSAISSAAGARLLVAVGVGLIAAVVTIAAIQVRATAPEAAEKRKDLVSRIQTRQDEADRLQDEVEALRDEVDAMEDTNVSPAEAKRAGILAVTTGADPVEGPGVKIVVDDAENSDGRNGANQDPRQAEALANGRVLDRDLQHVVNGLWSVGAEAIGINGQRLTVLSAIRAAGASILVDNRPLSPPYTVLAIGDAKKMQVDFQVSADGGYMHWLTQQFGIRATIGTQKKIKLPAAIGMTLRVARPGDAAPEPAAPTTPPATTRAPAPTPGPTATPGTGTVSPSAGTTGKPGATGSRTPSPTTSVRAPTPSKTGKTTTGAATRLPSNNASARGTGTASAQGEGKA